MAPSIFQTGGFYQLLPQNTTTSKRFGAKVGENVNAYLLAQGLA